MYLNKSGETHVLSAFVVCFVIYFAIKPIVYRLVYDMIIVLLISWKDILSSLFLPDHPQKYILGVESQRL